MRAGLLLWAFAAVAGMATLPVGAEEGDGARFTSFLGFRLNIGTLDDVQGRLGRARLVESYDDGEYQASVCYLGSDGMVSFLSGRDGGAMLGLLGFELQRSATAAAQNCRQLPRHLADASRSLGGLRLGMSRQDFAALMGAPVQWDGDTGRCLFQGEQPMSAGERAAYKDSPELNQRGSFNVLVTVTARFEDGQLVDVAVWKVVSA